MKVEGKTIWLIVLTILVVLQFPLSGLSLVSLFGYSTLKDSISELEEKIDDKITLDMEYVNSIAGIIFQQAITNCLVDYRISILNNSQTAETELGDCVIIGELGLRALEDIKNRKFGDQT